MSGQDEDSKMTDPEFQRFKVALLRRGIERFRRLYARSRNPIHALQAFRMARAAKIDIPGWILELFDQWAEALCVEPPKEAKAIADALGLGTKAGPSITAQAQTQARDWWIADRVLVLRDCDPERDMQDIFLEVAEDYKLSGESVSRIWYGLTRRVKKSR
jgi:hypothetical protein